MGTTQPTKEAKVTTFPEYRIYKPNKDKTGAASKLQIRIKEEQFRKVLMFWESAPQTGIDENGNASFAWEDVTKKVVFKLEAGDIGEILSVLNGVKTSVGTSKDGKPGSIFHENANGNTVFGFSKLFHEASKMNYYAFSLSSKKKDGKLISVKHTISLGEAEVLKILFSNAISLIYNWK